VDVAADDGVHPDAGVVAELHVADDLGRDVDEHAVAEPGPDAFVGPQQGLLQETASLAEPSRHRQTRPRGGPAGPPGRHPAPCR